MSPADLTRARDVLLGGGTVEAACEAAGVCRRTLERTWPDYQGDTLVRWLKASRGGSAKPPPPVSFRLSPGDRAELHRRAEAAGVSPSEFARSLVLEALDRRG